MAIGRISGPLLKANLLREGVNLAFENDLLYLDVNNARIGINTDNPQYDLDVSGTTRTTSLEVSNQAQISSVNIVGNNISTTETTLSLGTADNVIYQNKLTIDDIDITNNTISTNVTDRNLELRPNGTGSVEMFADTNVYGNIVATGNITANGNIVIGDADTDNITFNAEVISDIIPDANEVYDLGSDHTIGGKRWQSVYTKNAYVDSLNTSLLTVDGIDISLRQGNIVYVAANGNDSNSGTHQNDPYLTITHALENVSQGDTVLVYPGEYTETFPLEIPQGVTLKGYGLRSVTITPTVETQTNDGILLNGETTVDGLTLKGFYNSYGFRFADQITVNSRSPYVKNVSVITQGSVTSANDINGFDAGDAGSGAFLDGSVASASSKEASCLFHSVTFITPGVTALELTNGARVEWLSSFTYFADKSVHAYTGNLGLKGNGKSAIRVDNVTGSFSPGDAIQYYSSEGELLESAIIDSVDSSGKILTSGYNNNFEVYTERSGKEATVHNGAHLSDLNKRFGSTSLSLNGENEYISYSSDNDFGFGLSDFTVEVWVNTNSNLLQTLFDFRAGTDNDNGLRIDLDGLTPRIYLNGAYALTGSTDLPSGIWTHLSYVKDGNTGTIYVNGTSAGSWVDNNDYGNIKPLIIGATYNGLSNFFDGYIDELRISKSVARYTSNYAVQSSEFKSDDYAILLLHFNGDDSSNIIVDDSKIVQDIRFSSGATAEYITLADFSDFGAEIRALSSASVYGNYGAYGEGSGVLMYLVSHNFAYIGNGKKSDNDNTTVIQENEVVEVSRAKVRYNSVDHKGDFRVGDLFYVNQDSGEITFTSSDLNVRTSSGINITTGNSQTSITGEYVTTGNLRLSENTISSISGDIILDADSDTLRIVSSGSIVLPNGTTAERPEVPEKGAIRFNTDTNLFEGYDGNWIALNGVYDLDLDTYITAEQAPGVNDNTLRFYIEGLERLSIDENVLSTPKIQVGDIVLENNNISALNDSQDLRFSSTGTGTVLIDEIAFKNSSITNTTQDGVLEFRQTGNGYFKITGTSGFVVPVGENSNRPGANNREVGMTRFNTEQGYLESWDGNSWVSVAGQSGSINYNAAEDIAIEYVLTLG